MTARTEEARTEEARTEEARTKRARTKRVKTKGVKEKVPAAKRAKSSAAKPATKFTATLAANSAAKSAAKPAKKVKPANLKTFATAASVAGFLSKVPDAGQRADSKVIAGMFAAVTRDEPRMWGPAIVGYGECSYVGKSGRGGDWFMCGFSPRKANLTLYMLGGWQGDQVLLGKLGKHSLGQGCLYVKRLSDVDTSVLKTLIADGYKRAKGLLRTSNVYSPREA